MGISQSALVLSSLSLKACAAILILSYWTIVISSLDHNLVQSKSFDERDTASGVSDTRSKVALSSAAHEYHGDNFYSDSLCTNFLSGTLRQIDVCLQYDAKSSLKYLLSDVGKDNTIDVLTVHYSDLNCRNLEPVSLDHFSTECTQVDTDRYQKTSLPAVDDYCIVGRGRLR